MAVESRHWQSAIRTVDFLVVIGGLQAAVMLREFSWPISQVQFWITIMIPLQVICFNLSGAYSHRNATPIEQRIARVLGGLMLLILSGLLIAYFLRISQPLPRLALGSWLAICCLLLPGVRLLHYWSTRHLNYIENTCVIIAEDTRAYDLASHLNDQPDHHYTVIGVISLNQALAENTQTPILGQLDQLTELYDSHSIKSVLICTTARTAQDIFPKVHELLKDKSCIVTFAPSLEELALFSSPTDYEAGQPMLGFNEHPWEPHQQTLKWVEDKLLAFVALLIFAIPMLLIALLVKISSPGPILFIQQRHGLGGRAIKVWKFRTMAVDTGTLSGDGQERTETGSFARAKTADPRITKIGRFLRTWSLDELPQFFNVLQGRMSLVGPRPHAVAMHMDYAPRVPGIMLRHSVKPGITGLAQITGSRGSVESTRRMKKRIDQDLEYIRTWSLILDLKILLITLFKGFYNKAP